MRIFAALSVLVAVGGCLPDDPPVDGKLLYPGTGIENPSFSDPGQFDGVPWVFFQLRRARRASTWPG
jgi:hypothetical protein